MAPGTTANENKTRARWLKVLGCGIALAAALGSGSAFAGEHRFTVLLDTDNNALTGCSVVTAKGVAPGIEQAWTTVVTTTAVGATVTRIERQTCAGGTLGAPTVFATAGWSAGLGNGTLGTAALETYIPLADLPTQGSMKVWVASTNATGGQDATAPFVIALGGNSGPGNSGVTAVPLSPWLVLPLGFLMFVGVAWLRRWQPERVALVLCAVIIAASGLVWAAKVTLDGNIGDWQGIAPVAGNAKGSAPVDANIVGVFYQSDSSNLYFRIDADVRADASGNQAPVVSAGTDQTITLPAVANLNGTASDDGLPNPPGKLTLTWSLVVGPAPVTFGNAAAAVNTATFTQPGVYTLRLTADDSALSSSSDTHVTVNPASSSAPLFLAIADSTIPLGARYQQVLAANENNSTITYTLTQAPAGAAFNPPPLIDWTPTAAQLGLHTFTAQATDAGGHKTTVTFHVTVVYVDHPPLLGPQADQTLLVGAPFSRTLTATDPDVGDTLTLALVAGPPGMTLTGSVLNWTTTGLAPGDYPVTLKVTDGSGLFDTRHFVVTLVATSPPVANDDHYQVVLGQTLTMPAPGVLGNDIDANPGTLSAIKLSDPDKGVLNAFNADGSFAYQAPAALSGPVFAPVIKYHVDTLLFTDPPLVADVDGDGKPELIFLGAGSVDGITAVRGTDGSMLWNTPVLPAPDGDCTAGIFAGGNFYHLALGDIDDSGQLSIVFPTSCGRDNLPTQIVGTNVARYAALNAKDGSLKWLSPPLSRELDATGNPANLAFGTVPTLARVRVGETPSIVVGLDASYFFFNGKPECDQLIAGWPANVACRGVIVLDGKDGSVRQRMAAPIAGSYDITTYGNGTQAAVVADLAGDGNIEFIFGGAVFNNDGSIRWNNTDNNTGEPLSFWNGVANFDDTPDIEIARLEGNGSGSGPDRLSVYKSDGSKLWSLPLPDTAYTSLPVIADVDGSGRPAVVLAVGGSVCAVDYQGTYKWCHDVGAPGGVSNVSLGSRVQVYDLDGTGVPAVIVAVNGEVLLFLDGKTGNVKSSLDMGAANGPPFAPFPQSGVGGPVVADLDGSGHAAIATLWYGPLGPRLDVVAAQNNDWRPIRKIFNQESYQFGNVNDDGTIPPTFVNNFATPATNVFAAQPQLLPAVDPRLRTQTTFTYKANAGLQSSSPATVTIDILPTNRPPVFVSTPPTRYVGQSAFSYTAHAIDPDPGDTVTYSLLLGHGNGPNVFGNCTMGPSTGVLSCGILYAGEQDFIIVATDNFGAQAFQNIVLQASPGPAAVPNVVGQTQAAGATTLTGAGFATGIVTQIFNTAPAGQVIAQAPSAGTNALLGSSVDLSVSQGPMPVAVPFVVGQPLPVANAQLTGLGFTVIVTLVPSATNPVGEVLAQSPALGTMLAPTPANPITLTVSSGPAPALANIASLVVKPAVSARVVGENVPFTATAIYNNGTSADFTLAVTWASLTPGVATVDVNGIAHAVGQGSTTITAKVGTFTGQATLNVSAFVPGDSVPPTALITAPAGGATVTAPTQVLGTATDANFLRYELAFAPAGGTTYTLIGEGTAPVTSGVLGTFDPTLLINRLYTLRLTVFDSGGNQSVATSTVQVSGNMKVGLFTLTYQDLAIPLSGIPITVSRTYDSRDKGQGDFGIGWRLGIQSLRISSNRVLGTGWLRTQSGAVITLSATDEHKVSLTLSDGYVEEFDMQVSPTSNIGSLDATTVTGFVPRAGTVGQLQALANNSLLILNAGAEDLLVDDTTLNTYDPQLFRYTTADGTQIDIDRIQGVKKVTDLNGNSTTFGPGGIIHSSGKSVVFTRDAQGRITQIIDPLGNVQSYAYDLNGDLVSHTDAVGNTSRYAYNGMHGLIDIQDPAGNHAARNDYDGAGRLIATTDANGNQITFTNDLATSRVIMRDRLGNPTILDYDAAGNVSAKTDALGKVTTFTYDSRNNQLTQTDPLGRVASKTYDSKNNVLASTDFDGNTTTTTYNSVGQVLTTTDQEGRTTTKVYDGSANLTQVTDPEGGVTGYTYDGAGNRLTSTDPLGSVTTFTYDVSGNKTSETDPLGKTTTYIFDANSRPLSKTDAMGKTERYAFDAAGRAITKTDKLGNVTTLTYSAIGNGQKVASQTDPMGRSTLLEYDVLGNLTKTTNPDGTLASTTYDAESHPVSKTDTDGHTTAFQYDAVGQQTKTTYADGAIALLTHDAVGRALTRTDERGKTTTYTFAPNQQTVADALGNVTVHQFDSHGRRVQTTDALGHVIRFAYDSAGNPLKTTFPDGTFTTTTYDAAKRRAAVTDQAGRSTLFAYDAAGRLIQVTDAAGGKTSYTYDPVGRRLTQSDANSHTTQMSYDDLDRVVSRTRPSGKQETFAYDGAGNQLSHTDFSGQTTSFIYDALNRLTQKNLPGGNTVTYAWTGTGLRTQAGGDSYIYDTRGRLLQEHKASGDTLTYAYDAAGNKTSVTTPHGTTNYTYDALNRMATVVDAAGTTAYTYDADGNLANTAYPNGVTATYSYDTLNRLLHLANSGSGGMISSYTYTLGPVGNRVQVVEAGSATTGRTVAYTFDPVYRLIQEQITEPGPVIQTVTYSYDAVGNRIQMNRDGATTTHTYDANDRLVTEVSGAGTFTSSYDDNGNLTSRGNGINAESYTYDAENRLISAITPSGAVSLTYDADGMRTGETAGGVTTAFLVDKGVATGSCGCKADDAPAYAQVLAETVGPNVITYTYGHSLIDQTQAGVGTHFYLADGQLSTRQLTNNAGAVTDTYTFDAFGVSLASAGSTPNTHMYAGEQLDPNLGFYYLRARYYNQAAGRFLTADAEEGNIFEPVSLHRYLYANANPVDFRDPSGELSIVEVGLVQALYASLTAGALVTIGYRATHTAKDWGKALAYGGLTTLAVFSTLAGGVFFVQAELDAAGGLFTAGKLLRFAQLVRLGQADAAITALRLFVLRALPFAVGARCLFIRGIYDLAAVTFVVGFTIPGSPLDGLKSESLTPSSVGAIRAQIQSAIQSVAIALGCP